MIYSVCKGLIRVEVWLWRGNFSWSGTWVHDEGFIEDSMREEGEWVKDKGKVPGVEGKRVDFLVDMKIKLILFGVNGRGFYKESFPNNFCWKILLEKWKGKWWGIFILRRGGSFFLKFEREL